MRDYTLKKYGELCRAALRNHRPATVLEYLVKKPARAVVFRHDVDRRPHNAVDMARLESDLGIASTYYFRTTPDVFRKEIMEEIMDLGHEIGYHYEVLDKAGGDYEKAITLFKEEIARFPCEVKTICMHGNPLTRWDNRDLWKRYVMQDYGIVGEAYLSIDYTEVLYFTDTGRTWNGKYAVKDCVLAENPYAKTLRGTGSLIALLERKELGDICILAHPDRWTDSYVGWAEQLVSQTIKNGAKRFIRWRMKAMR